MLCVVVCSVRCLFAAHGSPIGIAGHGNSQHAGRTRTVCDTALKTQAKRDRQRHENERQLAGRDTTTTRTGAGAGAGAGAGPSQSPTDRDRPRPTDRTDRLYWYTPWIEPWSLRRRVSASVGCRGLVATLA